MKTFKPALPASTEEECGVWLDTVQLKGKSKQKRLARPISKLLNPLAEVGGYSLAVALNFTQTKIQMPNTKQSSISSFFAPQRRVLNKMSTSEVPNTDPVDSSSPSSTATTCASIKDTPTAVGTKRKRHMDPVSDLYNTEKCQVKSPHTEFAKEGAAHEWKSENVTENETTVWQEHYKASQTPRINMDHESEEEQSEEQMNQPEGKRRLTETSSLPVESDPLGQECSQDPWITCSSPQYSQELNDPSEMKQYDHITQDSDSQLYLTHLQHPTAKQVSDSGAAFLESLQSEEGFGLWMGVEGRTSTQKSFKHIHSSQMDEEKENNRPLSSKSPNKCFSLSPLKPLTNHTWAKPKMSPQKRIAELLWKKAEDESLDSQYKWTKPNGSPLKKCTTQQSCREVEADSLAMLFTQDSEGFRVIAHHGLSARSPLKDQTNLSIGRVKRTIAYKSTVEDEEEEMLFTQDSQGNMVIKH